MDLKIAGKVAVVCGGARGTGLEIAKRLAKEGVKVGISGRYEDIVRSAEEEIRSEGGEVIGIVIDAIEPGAPEEIRAKVEEEFGKVGIVVINFATVSSNEREFLNVTDEEFEKSYQTYFMAPVRMLRAFLPGMKEMEWGRVITLGSANSKNPSLVDPMIAQAVRVGGAALLKNLTFEYSRYNISFNTLAIGAFETDLAKSYLETAPQGAYQAYADLVPLKRWGQVGELASMVVYLCGQESAYVNGEVIRVDGGQTASLF